MRAVVLGLVLVAAAATSARAQAPVPEAENEPEAEARPEDASAEQAVERETGPWDSGVSAEQRRAAREHMLEGNRLIKVPLFAQAAARYRQALALWPHPAIHYNLGIAQLNLVQPIEAYKSFEEAMRHGPGPLGQEKFEQGKEYLAILETRLARIAVSCDIAGAEVTLDGELLFTGPGAREEIVNPGRHQLVASKPENVPDTRQVAVSPGERARAVLVPRSVDEVARRERRWAVWKPWVAVAAGAGLIAGAGYLDWRSSSGFDDFARGFEDECRPRGCAGSDIPDLVEQKEAAELEQGVALGLYIAGGTALAVGAALIYFNREQLVHRQEARPAVSITPVVTGTGGGLSASVRF
jgi:tetratricopeptide (TPR) repeat protein